MSVVAPITALAAAGLPVLYGIVRGERPSGLAIGGVVLGLASIWLISMATGPDEERAGSSGVIDGRAISAFARSSVSRCISSRAAAAALDVLTGSDLSFLFKIPRSRRLRPPGGRAIEYCWSRRSLDRIRRGAAR